MGDFCETGIEIWAGFGPIGSTEKKGSWLIMSHFGLVGGFFMSSGAKKILEFFKNIVASALKSCIKLSYFFIIIRFLKNWVFFGFL